MLRRQRVPPITTTPAATAARGVQRRRERRASRDDPLVISHMRKIGFVVARIAAWAWAIVAGIGGLALLVDQGPLPVTNGWFAMFSGIAACPLTASLLHKHARITVPGHVQFALALLILVAGRIAVAVILHRPFLPQCSDQCW